MPGLSELLERDEKVKDPKQLADEIMDQFKEAVQYKRSMGYYDTWAECERFKIGDQWPPPTEKTKDLPRPVVNVIKRIVEQKTAVVLAENPTLYFYPDEGTPDEGISEYETQGAELFTQAAKNTWYNVRMDDMNDQAVDLAATVGTAFSHWYWDNSIIAGDPSKGTAFIGDIAGEILGPDKVFVGKPDEEELQKQPWIIITSRMLLREAREKYRKTAAELGVNVDEIQPDNDNSNEVYDALRITQSPKYVNVIHRYWKTWQGPRCFVNYAVVINGKVVRLETPLYEGDLYPLAVFRWNMQQGAFYGIGEVHGLIPNQKQINRMLAIYLLSLYTVGWPKIKYRPGVVDPSQFDNMPGGFIADLDPQLNGWKYEQPQSIASGNVTSLLDQLLSISKELSGANEAFLGEAPGADLNASAIMALQRAANTPVERIRKRFYRYLEDVARIWELFYKRFYQEERVIRIRGAEKPEGFIYFRGTDYYDLRLGVKVQAGAGSVYSEILLISELKEMLAKGYISFDEYLEMLPKQAFPFAEKILEKRRQMAARQAQMQAMMAQVQAQAGGQIPPNMPPMPVPMMIGGGENGQGHSMMIGGGENGQGQG